MEKTTEPNRETTKSADVAGWQIKKLEHYTIKFPSDWYWLETSPVNDDARSFHVISNNQSLDPEKFSESMIFSDIGPSPSVSLKEKTDIVVTDWGVPTSNAGSPMDSINSRIELAKQNYPSVVCDFPKDAEVIPLVASCKAVYENEHQAKKVFYIADEGITLIISFNTTEDTMVDENIFEEIARGVELIPVKS